MSAQEGVKVEQTGKTAVIRGSREYVTSDNGDVPAFRKFVEDETYAQALSSLVVKCVDVVVYDPDTGRVLVGTRDQEPQSADWVIGGRKRAGESDRQSAVRNLRRELGENVAAFASDHLQHIGTQYDLIWDTREQDNTTNEQDVTVTSCHMSSSPMALPISESLFNSMAKQNEEYSDLRWEDGFELYEAPAGTYHPAHQDMVFDTLERVATQPE